MAEELKDSLSLGLTTQRIETLTDGVFAIAMTLLVLTIELPAVGQHLTNSGILNMLNAQSYKLHNYFLSFILLAVFWMVHHQQFHYIRRTNRTHIWINVFFLMFVALIPFSASLMGDYPTQGIADFVFALNMFSVGIMLEINWLYATINDRLVDKNFDTKRILTGLKRGLVTPIVSVIAMILAYVNPDWASYSYLLILVLLWLPFFRR